MGLPLAQRQILERVHQLPSSRQSPQFESDPSLWRRGRLERSTIYISCFEESGDLTLRAKLCRSGAKQIQCTEPKASGAGLALLNAKLLTG